MSWYADVYLQSEHWQGVRKAVLEERGRRCQACAATDVQVNVHHNNYDNLWKETRDDVIVLCRYHHSLFHDKLSEPPDQPESSKRNGKQVQELEDAWTDILTAVAHGPPSSFESHDPDDYKIESERHERFMLEVVVRTIGRAIVDEEHMARWNGEPSLASVAIEAIQRKQQDRASRIQDFRANCS